MQVESICKHSLPSNLLNTFQKQKSSSKTSTSSCLKIYICHHFEIKQGFCISEISLQTILKIKQKAIFSFQSGNWICMPSVNKTNSKDCKAYFQKSACNHKIWKQKQYCILLFKYKSFCIISGIQNLHQNSLHIFKLKKQILFEPAFQKSGVFKEHACNYIVKIRSKFQTRYKVSKVWSNSS
jgi:hypothetical protein